MYFYALLSRWFYHRDQQRARPPMKRTPIKVAFRRPLPGTRRGMDLWLLSTVIGLKGVGYIFSDSPESANRSLVLPVQLLDPVTDMMGFDAIRAWGVIIVAITMFSGFCAYCHHGRDQYGFRALLAFASVWIGCYLLSPLLFGQPWYAVQGALSWLVIAVFIYRCARQPSTSVDDVQRCAA